MCDYGRALADLNQAIRLDPRNALACARRADAEYMREDNDQALADCNEAFRLDFPNPSDRAQAHALRGWLYLAKG